MCFLAQRTRDIIRDLKSSTGYPACLSDDQESRDRQEEYEMNENFNGQSCNCPKCLKRAIYVAMTCETLTCMYYT